MTRVMQQKVERDRTDKRVERKREFMSHEREAVSKGKKPFFLKKREIREAELKDRFESLRKRGKLKSTWRRSVGATLSVMRRTCRPFGSVMSNKQCIYSFYLPLCFLLTETRPS